MSAAVSPPLDQPRVGGDPELLLAALDPEQREVATALHGPVAVIAGAGTGKTRAITHRIAYGVAVGAYQPTAVLAVTFTTRAAGEMRGRLQQLGARGVQARTFHSAALRQAQYFWPQGVRRRVPVGAGQPDVAGRRVGQPTAGAGRHRPAARPAGRDLLGQGQQHHPGGLPAGRGPAGTHRVRHRPGDGGAHLHRLRGPEAAARPDRLRGHPALHRGPAGRARRDPGPGAAHLPAPGGRRVPGRVAAAASAARALAGRPGRALRGRRPGADHPLLRRGAGRLPHRVRATAPDGDRGPAGARLPLDPAGRGRRQRRDARRPGPAGQRPYGHRRGDPAGAAARRTGAGAAGGAGRGGRGGRDRRLAGRAGRARAWTTARWPCCSGSTPSRR